MPDTVADWKNAEQTALDGLRHGAQSPLVLEERQRRNGAPHPHAAHRANGADAAQDPPSPSEQRWHQTEPVGVEEQERPQAEAEPEAAANPDDVPKGAVLPPELHGCPLTEDGVAEAFAIEHGDDLRFCHGPNRWHWWDGTRWKVEQTRLAFSWVRDLSRRMARGTASKSLRATLGKAAFAAGVERLAQADRAFAVTPEQWDRDPWLLGTLGGTIDLRTGELHPARREDYITKQASVTPADAGTPFPVWAKFLDEITCGDHRLRRFIQQIAGYCLTGDVREECIFFLFGSGSNGKGTLLRTVANAMGDYAVAADMATFTASQYDRHPADLAKLAGARMVTATETERDRTWAWSRIKELTGNERPISARFMRQDFFEFWVTFKLAFAGNHKPHLPATDEATARRLNLLPFNFVARGDRDDTLKERLVPEYPAILRWAVHGCLDWQANGLMRPEVVIQATQSYLEEQDLFTQWVDSECTTDLQDSATHKALFASWTRFALANAEQPGSGRSFSERLIAAGFIATKHTPRDNAQRGWLRIALRREPEPEQSAYWVAS